MSAAFDNVAAAETSMAPPSDWRKVVRQIASQEPLIETRPTLISLDAAAAHEVPRAVFVGVGLCQPAGLSLALPLDILGMLIPAERIRSAIGATETVILIADSHAVMAGFDAAAVDEAARATIKSLRWIQAAMKWPMIRAIRASTLRGDAGYRYILDEVVTKAGPLAPPYFVNETADIEFFRRAYGQIVKVGWTIASGADNHYRDETAFDRYFDELIGGGVTFVYCVAGRALDDQRPKASPYVATDPAKRVCLVEGESVFTKLQGAAYRASFKTVRGFCNHLQAVVRSAARFVPIPKTSREQRIQNLIQTIVPHHFAAG